MDTIISVAAANVPPVGINAGREGARRSARRPQPESPNCDCDYLDACTGSCLEPVGGARGRPQLSGCPSCRMAAAAGGGLWGRAMNDVPAWALFHRGVRLVVGGQWQRGGNSGECFV